MWILRCLRRVKPSQQHNTATQIRKVQRPALPPLPSPTPSCFHEADELSTEQGERAPVEQIVTVVTSRWDILTIPNAALRPIIWMRTLWRAPYPHDYNMK